MNYNEDGFNEFAEEMQRATNEYATKIEDGEIDDVAIITQRITNKVLNEIDKIEDSDLALELTQFLGAILGGYSQAILNLKHEVLELRRVIINKRSGEQDFTLN